MAAHIVGWFHLPFGKLDTISLESLIVHAARGAIHHAEIAADEVDAMWLGNLNGGLVPDLFCSSMILGADDGLRWKPSIRIENACASGASAVYSACDAIESGRSKIALVVGAEKMTEVDGSIVTNVLADCSYVKEESASGLTFPGIFAKLTRSYFDLYGDHSLALAKIAVKNHANAVNNPWAHIRKELTLDFCNTISDKNPYIAEPLRKTDCSLVSDGAAALILADESIINQFPRAVKFRSRVQVNDYLPLSKRVPIAFEGPKRAWALALAQAGCSIKDISFAEIHDCFTIAELLTYEAMGLANAGEGSRLIDEGAVHLNGSIPINPSGGLKAKGHPIGATGVSMHVLSAMQLCNEALEMQIENASLAGIFNMGGSAVVNCVSILERAH